MSQSLFVLRDISLSLDGGPETGHTFHDYATLEETSSVQFFRPKDKTLARALSLAWLSDTAVAVTIPGERLGVAYALDGEYSCSFPLGATIPVHESGSRLCSVARHQALQMDGSALLLTAPRCVSSRDKSEGTNVDLILYDVDLASRPQKDGHLPQVAKEVRRYSGAPADTWDLEYVEPWGQIMASGDDFMFQLSDYGIRLWDVEKGTLVGLLKKHTDVPSPIGALPAFNLVISYGVGDSHAYVWDRRTFEVVHSQDNASSIMAWSSHGPVPLFARFYGGEMEVYDIRNLADVVANHKFAAGSWDHSFENPSDGSIVLYSRKHLTVVDSFSTGKLRTMESSNISDVSLVPSAEEFQSKWAPGGGDPGWFSFFEGVVTGDSALPQVVRIGRVCGMSLPLAFFA